MPDPQVAAAAPMLPLSSLVLSKTNPRQHFDPVKLNDLAASLKGPAGMINPILCRPLKNGTHEVVAGSRRYRAAGIAKLAQVPVRIEQLTDAQVLEIQLVENLQSEDVHPLEEARGFQALLAMKGYTADSIAEKIGKDRSYVYKRIQLAALIPPLQKAFFDEEIHIGHALYLCRCQPADQELILKQHLFSDTYEYDEKLKRRVKTGREAMSVKDLANWIGTHLLSLSAAPWKKDDAQLVPKAGSCNACPKRSGANLALFDDVAKGDDRCLDRACYQGKQDAFIARQIALAEGAGNKLLRVSDTYTGYREHLPKGVLDHNSYHAIADKKDTCPNAKPAIVVVGRSPGKLLDVCVGSCSVHRPAYSRGQYSSGRSSADIWKQKRKDVERQVLSKARHQALRAIVDKTKAVGPRELGWIVGRLLHRLDFENRKRLAEFLEVTVPKGETHRLSNLLQRKLEEMKPERFAGAAVAAALVGDVEPSAYRDGPDSLAIAAKALRVDLAGIARKLRGPALAGLKRRQEASNKRVAAMWKKVAAAGKKKGGAK